MSRKKIADSIIIRVGGGIREVPRHPVEMPINHNAADQEAGFEHRKKMGSHETERLADQKGVAEKNSA
ncbi:MAG: hypothetical protein JRD39_04875 [Deltaproteobacteria bacterium]|jgi:hypothetical protein|nr:hypothetical protein [Deltaproteobacteria bacterium]